MVCSTLDLTQLVGKKWTFVLLQEISLRGDKGFNSIHRRMKISPKMLAQRLTELELAKIISKQSAPLPLKSHYSLTERGTELYAILQNLQQWNARHSQLNCASECTSCPQYEQSF